MRLVLSTVAAAALTASSMFSMAVAAPLADQTAMHHATADFAPIEKTQFFWGGQNYCWYPVGWHGPGYYWCGYAWRRGYGWGGGRGWGRGHGWGGHHGGWGGHHGGWGGHHGGWGGHHGGGGHHGHHH